MRTSHALFGISHAPVRWALALPFLMVCACTFDFADYDFMAAAGSDAGGDGDGDGDGNVVDAGGDGDGDGDGDGPAALFVNECNLGTDPLPPSPVPFDVSTLSFDNTWEVDRCTVPAIGLDGFFAVSLRAGEKWHFHLKSDNDGVDPVLYIVDACDERRCLRAQTSNNCASKVEHMSFVPDRDGTYMVGLDTVNSGGAELNFLAIQPVCGNGEPEHSEGCEDGNRVDGDGCDHLCRTEIGPGDEESEPNDDFTSANVVFFANNESEIRGTISGACDLEKFAIDIPQDGQGLSAELLLGPNGTPCAAGDVPENLKLELYEGESLVGEGLAVPGGNACPVIDERFAFANNLTRGTYHVNFITPDNTENFDYILKLTLR